MDLFKFHDFLFVFEMNRGWMVLALLLGILVGWFTSGNLQRKAQ